LKSFDTNGSWQYSRIPAKGPPAACRRARLTSSTVTGPASSATRSTTDTLGVGTRKAIPFKRPASSGNTFPTARAAPVVVGMMESGAARARRGSSWGRSRIRWSLV
jgi:hypothetical protein